MRLLGSVLVGGGGVPPRPTERGRGGLDNGIRLNWNVER